MGKKNNTPTISPQGLLDPYNPSDREGPRYGANARPGTGFNLLAQGLAQNYSPPTETYFSPASFMSNGGPSQLSQYVPDKVKSGGSNWEQTVKDLLLKAGMGATPPKPTTSPTLPFNLPFNLPFSGPFGINLGMFNSLPTAASPVNFNPDAIKAIVQQYTQNQAAPVSANVAQAPAPVSPSLDAVTPMSTAASLPENIQALLKSIAAERGMSNLGMRRG